MRFRIKCLTKKEKNNFDLKVDRGLKIQLSNIITKMLIISMNSCSNVNKNDIYEFFLISYSLSQNILPVNRKSQVDCMVSKNKGLLLYVVHLELNVLDIVIHLIRALILH